MCTNKGKDLHFIICHIFSIHHLLSFSSFRQSHFHACNLLYGLCPESFQSSLTSICISIKIES